MLKGLGTLGANVRLVDGGGKTMLRRTVRPQVLTGCRRPDTVNLAVCESGDYTLRVQFADAAVKQQKLTIGAKKQLSLTVSND